MSTKAEVRPRVFLDTSIQVTRILGAPTQRQQIEYELSHTVQAYTTTYVYMEFQRTVISDFAHVHRVLQKESDWGTAIAAVASGQRLFRPRALARVNRILGETLNRSHLDREKGILLLTTYIESRLQRLFWRQVAPFSERIHCDLVASGVTRQPDNSYVVAEACRKETAACHLPSFLAEQSTKLRLMRDYLANYPRAIKDQSRVERLLASIQADPRNALGQTTCWPLGDIIILLQVPSDCAVWTLDPDFAPLAKALALTLYTPTSLHQSL